MSQIVNYFKDNWIAMIALGAFALMCALEIIIIKIRKKEDSLLRKIVFTFISLLGVIPVLKLIENDLFVWGQVTYANVFITNALIGGVIFAYSAFVVLIRSLVLKRKFSPFTVKFIFVSSLLSLVGYYVWKENKAMYEHNYIALLIEMVFTSLFVSFLKFGKTVEVKDHSAEIEELKTGQEKLKNKLEKVILLLTKQLSEDDGEEEDEESEEESETSETAEEESAEEEVEIIIKEYEMTQELLLEEPHERVIKMKVPKSKAIEMEQNKKPGSTFEYVTPVKENVKKSVSEENPLPFEEQPITLEEEIEEFEKMVDEPNEPVQEEEPEEIKEEVQEVIDNIEEMIETIEEKMESGTTESENEEMKETIEEIIGGLDELIEEIEEESKVEETIPEPQIVDGILIMPDEQEVERIKRAREEAKASEIADSNDLDSLIGDLEVKKAPHTKAPKSKPEPKAKGKKSQLSPEQRELELIERRLRKLKKQIASRDTTKQNTSDDE